MTRRVVLGIGLSSSATAAEVRDLVDAVLLEHGLRLDDVACLATRERFAGDERLPPRTAGRRLWPTTCWKDSSQPPERTVGIRARVAETAALLAAAGPSSSGTSSPKPTGSPHATAALAASDGGAR